MGLPYAFLHSSLSYFMCSIICIHVTLCLPQHRQSKITSGVRNFPALKLLTSKSVLLATNSSLGSGHLRPRTADRIGYYLLAVTVPTAQSGGSPPRIKKEKMFAEQSCFVPGPTSRLIVNPSCVYWFAGHLHRRSWVLILRP